MATRATSARTSRATVGRFAPENVNGLDQFVKHRLRCQQYLRYCDDFVLLSDDREQLLQWRGAIEDHLQQTLQLELNPRQHLRPLSDGVDFLGYIVRRDYRLVRRRVVSNLRARLLAFEGELVGEGRLLRRYRFEPVLLDALYAVLCSYRGHLAKADSQRLWASLWKRFAFLGTYLDQDATTGKLVRKDGPPRQLTSVGAQYRGCVRPLPGMCCSSRLGVSMSSMPSASAKVPIARRQSCFNVSVKDGVRGIGGEDAR